MHIYVITCMQECGLAFGCFGSVVSISNGTFSMNGHFIKSKSLHQGDIRQKSVHSTSAYSGCTHPQE
jgi:hypothetical protein